MQQMTRTKRVLHLIPCTEAFFGVLHGANCPKHGIQRSLCTAAQRIKDTDAGLGSRSALYGAAYRRAMTEHWCSR
jgi:hypothetical protein